MVALLLPLSSLWASMAINNEAAQLDIGRLAGHMPLGSNNSNASNSSSCSYCGHCRGRRGIPSARATQHDEEKDGNFDQQFNATTTKNEVMCGSPRETNSRDSTEVDLESMGVRSGVRVVKSYSLQSGKADQISTMDR